MTGGQRPMYGHGETAKPLLCAHVRSRKCLTSWSRVMVALLPNRSNGYRWRRLARGGQVGRALDARRGSVVTRIRPVLVVFARTFLRKLGLVAGRRARSNQLIDSTYDFDLLRRRCGRGK